MKEKSPFSDIALSILHFPFSNFFDRSHSKPRNILLQRCIAALLVFACQVLGQEDDDDQQPGLHASYQVGTTVLERIDPDIAFAWNEASPDERLPTGKFAANWSGTLVIRGEEKYQFHAFAQGQVTLKVGNKVVLNSTAEQPRWISGPETSLGFGDQPFELTFIRNGDAAQLKLYWSSSEFPLEPVPYHAFFLAKNVKDLALIERGRIQFEAFRCDRCHTENRVESTAQQLSAPSLKHVGVGTTREWLIEKLTVAGDAKIAGKMPHWGLSHDDANAIIETLLSKSASVQLDSLPKIKESDIEKETRAGRIVVNSIGCLACHTWEKLGEETPYGGGALDEIARKRTTAWLTTWLADPAKLNPRHRMPVFKLTSAERAQIVLALTQSSSDNPVSVTESKVGETVTESITARGTRLIEKLRCGMCHELPEVKSASMPVMPLTDGRLSWSNGCASTPDRSKFRPGFPHADFEAIRAWVTSSSKQIVHSAPTIHKRADFINGRHLLERKNCLGCHDRDGKLGISKHAALIAKSDESLAGLQMTLIPPRLNSVGDKMPDAGLAEAIRGEQKVTRLNWLRVRMPRFQHTPAEQAALVAYLIGHDRIPDASAEVQGVGKRVPKIDPNATPDPQRLLAGRELLGGKGFSCVACHAIKDYTPKVTALGTRGSNLHLIGQRMRTDYFFRWTRAPLRVMPGVEMPSYQRPHEFILPGQLDEQMIAIWQTLNDPNLTAPTNPAVVEQLLSIPEDGDIRVVRDVFTVPGSTDETVAHSYAIGFPGGHSALFDLETGSVRGWTLGDFARQRCEGKRWYWDLAGTVLASGFGRKPDIFLVDKQSGEIIAPETGWDIECRFRDETLREGREVRFGYDLTFSRNGMDYRLHVRETLNGDGSGWQRSISARSDSAVWIWFRNAVPTELSGQSSITARGEQTNNVEGVPTTAIRFSSSRDGDSANVLVEYRSSLRWSLPPHKEPVPLISRANEISNVPGFKGRRLPLPRSIMPTAFAWDRNQRLYFTSLKGHVFRLDRSDNGEESLNKIDEGLAAPFGIIEDLNASKKAAELCLLVAHKPEILRLELASDGQVAHRQVLASGWGLTDDYHDWTCGIVRDSTGNLLIGLGSDYTFKTRPISKSRWRGDILRIDPRGNIESIAKGLRYPTGLAIDDHDNLFCTDQQGVQNTFNELNVIQVGHRYGVPSRHEPEPNAAADPPAVQIPHPWTRSVNGIAFIPSFESSSMAAIDGHFLGCEYNNNMLIRMTVENVDGVIQGAVYPFSTPSREGESADFVGPISIGVSPTGTLFVGGFQDGGWIGGLNMGDIVELTPAQELLNGIRVIRATKSGFEIEFMHEVDPELAVQTEQYKISGYTRIWKGDYATPDSGHHSCEISSAVLDQDHRRIRLDVVGRKPGHVYDVSVGPIGTNRQRVLWPAIGHYTLHKIPD